MTEDIKRYTTILLACFLLLCIFQSPAAACCDPPCEGCKRCVNGSCVDDDDACTGCQECNSGECEDVDSNCEGECSDCWNGSCIDDSDDCGACQRCESAECWDLNCDPTECESCIDHWCVECEGDTSKTCCDGICCRDGPDGCSTPTGDNPTLCTNTSFGNCCNGHDDCYWTCSSDPDHKNGCDVTFSNCMTAVCDALEGDEWVVCFVPCTAWRLAYWITVSIVGQGAYNHAQECGCCF